MTRVILHPAAQAELIEAAGRYDEQVHGLGERFLQRVEEATAFIQEYLECDRLGLTVVQLEVCRDASRQVEGGAAVVDVDGGGQDARLDVYGDRIEVVGGSQAPSVGAAVEEGVVAEMVVGVGAGTATPSRST